MRIEEKSNISQIMLGKLLKSKWWVNYMHACVCIVDHTTMMNFVIISTI